MLNDILQYKEICKELNNIYSKHTYDYVDGFSQAFVENGISISYKIMLDELSKFNELTDENRSAKSIDEFFEDKLYRKARDTLLNLADYAIMTIMEMERAKNGKKETKGKPAPDTTNTHTG